MKSGRTVAPFAGAWIEIRETFYNLCASSVAPFAGAWIEIKVITNRLQELVGRSLRGSVD